MVSKRHIDGVSFNRDGSCAEEVMNKYIQECFYDTDCDYCRETIKKGDPEIRTEHSWVLEGYETPEWDCRENHYHPECREAYKRTHRKPIPDSVYYSAEYQQKIYGYDVCNSNLEVE